MDLPKYLGYFKRTHQEILIEGFILFTSRINCIADKYIRASEGTVQKLRASQFLILNLISKIFGLERGATYSVFDSGTAELVKEYISNLDGRFFSRSTAERNMKLTLKACSSDLELLAGELQDFYYVSIGDRARSTYCTHFQKSRKSVTPMTECFIGIAPPSQIFPDLSVFERGIRIPFFNARIYESTNRISSTIELSGKIKTPMWENNTFIFQLAGELGFIAGAPGLHKFYNHFKWIETHLSELTKQVNEQLAREYLHDLTVVSVDSTNIPVDKRDKSGSIGKGSRGTFFGHKASIGAGANCMPISEILGSGRCSDTSLFDVTFTPMDNLAKKTGQDIWAGTADAGYTHVSVINRIEQADALPIVDLNPKNSRLLGKLKNAAEELRKWTKQAIKNGLSSKERKEWVGDVQRISSQHGGKIPLKTKIPLLKTKLRKLTERAKRKGLRAFERRKEKRARKKVMDIRQEIRQNGTPAEKKIGLPPIAHWTISWALIYAIRGQNEGINGILKKRNNMIGDGQHTTWIIHGTNIKGRLEGNFLGIKAIAWVYFYVSGKRTHLMRTIHNWRRERTIFVIIVMATFCRQTPIPLYLNICIIHSHLSLTRTSLYTKAISTKPLMR